MNAPLRWAQLAVVAVLVGCEGHPLAPDEAAPRLNDVTRVQAVAEVPAPGALRWLTLRADGLYDDQGRRRMSRAQVNALHIDKAFELHSQAKAQWLQHGAMGATRTQGKPSLARVTPATNAPNPTPAARASLSLSVPSGPRLAVAADDPCFFDATIWCSNELGGELGPPATGGGSSADGGYDPSGDDTNCSFVLNNMNNAFRLYQQAQAAYFLLAEGAVDNPFVSGGIEGLMMTQYNRMMSYYADYTTWRALATKYQCR